MTLKSRFEDFVDVVAGRQDPRKLMLRGRLRPGRPALAVAVQADVPGLEAAGGKQELACHDAEGGDCDECDSYEVHATPTGLA